MSCLVDRTPDSRRALWAGALCHGTWSCGHGPLARYVKFRVAHAPGMPGTFSPPLQVSDPDMHHVPHCMPESLTSGFLWSRWRGKRSRHSWRMRNPQFYVSGKRPKQPMSPWNDLFHENVSFVDGSGGMLFQDFQGGLSLAGECDPNMYLFIT